MERIHRRAAMAAMVCLCAVLASARAETVIVESETIDRLDMANADFPHIRFTGGLVLHSDDKHFGGFSGLATTNEGRDLIAVSDKGYWLTFSVEYNDTSQSPLRVANGGEAEIEPLLDMDGIPLHDRDNKKSWSDAESVVFEDYNEEEHELWPPPLLVSFERHHRIWRYANTTAPAMTDARLSISSQLLNESCAWNGGAEAMETLPPSRVHGHAGSSLIFFCEDPIDGDKTVFQGWTVEVESTRDYDTHHLFLQLEKGYKPTDFATMDNGDLVILERRHEDGITSFRLEIIHSSLLENDLSGGSGGGENGTTASDPSSVIVPAIIMESFSGNDNAVDNMEGVTIDYLDKGEIRIQVISDDNFSDQQKTILLTFEVPSEEYLALYALEKSHLVSLHPSLTAAERWVVGFAVGMAALVALGAAVGTVIIIRARLRERRGNQTYSSINELTRNEFQVSLSFSRGQRSNGNELDEVTELSD